MKDEGNKAFKLILNKIGKYQLQSNMKKRNKEFVKVDKSCHSEF